MNSGLPSLRRWTWRTRPAETGRAASRVARYSPTAGSGSRPSVMTRPYPCSASSPASRASGASDAGNSVGRYVPSSSSRARSERRATTSIASRVGRSAQWRSSSHSTSIRCAASASSKVASWRSIDREVDPLSCCTRVACSAGSVREGSSASQSGAVRRIESTSAAEPTSPARRSSAARIGRYGSAAPYCSTHSPLAHAVSGAPRPETKASTRLVLPIPGSPQTRITWRSPFRAPLSAAPSWSSSARRPTNGLRSRAGSASHRPSRAGGVVRGTTGATNW